MSSDDGHMSDYDFVDLQETNVYSSDDDSTVTSGLAPPKGWSTLSLSDADAAAAAKTGPAAVTGAARARREFISAVPTSPAAVARTSTSTRFEPGRNNTSGVLECSVCQRLLRDCVECPTCHSLLCRTHLRVDSNGKSPCPCEPCRSAVSKKETSDNNAPFSTTPTAATPPPPPVLHPASSFLPNIPVQRMADAVPSSCDGCGLSLTWGELGDHVCDQQLVPCDGCGWFGKRHLLEHHASTCAGKELVARAQHDALAARAELDLARRDRDEAERRASSAEMRASELEARLLQTEKTLRAKTVEAAAARTADAAAHMKKEESLQQQLREARAETAKLAADIAKRGEEAKAAKAAAAAAAAAAAEKTASSPEPVRRGSASRAAARAAAGATSGTTAPLGFAAMMGRAGLLPAPTAVPQHAAPEKRAAPAPAAASQATQTTAASTASRASGRSSSSSSSSKGALHAAVQMARGERSSGGGGGVMMDTACQAPVPSVEACLKPYLDRPKSLLERKVVVFWPR